MTWLPGAKEIVSRNTLKHAPVIKQGIDVTGFSCYLSPLLGKVVMRKGLICERRIYRVTMAIDRGRRDTF